MQKRPILHITGTHNSVKSNIWNHNILLYNIRTCEANTNIPNILNYFPQMGMAANLCVFKIPLPSSIWIEVPNLYLPPTQLSLFMLPLQKEITCSTCIRLHYYFTACTVQVTACLREHFVAVGLSIWWVLWKGENTICLNLPLNTACTDN